MLLSGGLSLCPLRLWPEPEAASGCWEVWQDTLHPQWGAVGRAGHPEVKWQRRLEGNNCIEGIVWGWTPGNQWIILFQLPQCESLLHFSCLQGLFIRMSKHPSCFRLTGDVLSDWTEDEGRRVLFSGSVAELCPLAPNNVNTMAAAAVAAGTLGFTGVRGEIVSDTAWVFLNVGLTLMLIAPLRLFYATLGCRLRDFHVVEVEVTGPGGFSVKTVRRNPASLGAVTGRATYTSFWNSLLGE